MPRYSYTDQQQGIMDWANNYAAQSPTEQKDMNKLSAYNRGFDPKGKLTAFMAPMQAQAGAMKMSAQDMYSRNMAAGFNQGGGANTARSLARLGREYDADSQRSMMGLYGQMGQQLHGNVYQNWFGAKQLEQGAKGIGAGVANSPQAHQTWGDFFSGLLQSGMAGFSQAAASKLGQSEAADSKSGP